jgi:hypothetical protein
LGKKKIRTREEKEEKEEKEKLKLSPGNCLLICTTPIVVHMPFGSLYLVTQI